MTEDTSNTTREVGGVFVTIIETVLVEIGRDRFMFVDGVWITNSTVIEDESTITYLSTLLKLQLSSGQYTHCSLKEVQDESLQMFHER